MLALLCPAALAMAEEGADLSHSIHAPGYLPRLLSVPLLIVMAAFFVAAEYSVVAMRAGQIETLRASGAHLAAAAMDRLKSNMSSTIGAIQICLTLANLMLGWVGEPAMSALISKALSPIGVFLPANVSAFTSTAISFIIVTLLTVVLSELLPKALTLQYTLLVARMTAVPMARIIWLITPAVVLVNLLANAITRSVGLGSVDIEESAHSAEEIRHIASEAGESGVLTTHERSLILNSLALGRRSAEEIMVPRVRVAYLDLQKSMADNMKVMNAYLYSRLPLCDGGMDHVVGVIYTKEFLTAFQEDQADSSVLSLIARQAVFVPVNIPLDKLMTVFREKKMHMVFLVDEYGGVEGTVTLTDVVDELVGEMDEGEQRQPTAATGLPREGHPIVVPGATSLRELSRRLGLDDWGDGEPVHTLGGLLSARLGHLPRAGEKVEFDGVILKVLEHTRRSVGKVEVTLRYKPPEPIEEKTE